MKSEHVEEYLEAIYMLTEGGRAAKNMEIVACLKIAPSSVTEMLKKLNDNGYIKYQPYRGVKLTNKGLKVARKITRKHRLLERFLYDVLKIEKKDVHGQACKMEHALSDEAEEALSKLLKYPERCPDNRPIPYDKTSIISEELSSR